MIQKLILLCVVCDSIRPPSLCAMGLFRRDYVKSDLREVNEVPQRVRESGLNRRWSPRAHRSPSPVSGSRYLTGYVGSISKYNTSCERVAVRSRTRLSNERQTESRIRVASVCLGTKKNIFA